jgi:hypothetical protein
VKLKLELEEGETLMYVPSFNGRYKISSFGDIYDCFDGRMISKKIHPATNRYSVSLYIYNTRLKRMVHKIYQLDKLVYCTFNTLQLNNKVLLKHLDGDILNDKLDNLKRTYHYLDHV